MKCWGYGDLGRLGSGTETDIGTAAGQMGDDLDALVLHGRTAQGVACGSSHSCALLDDDTVSCWGNGSYGKLGRGSSSDALAPLTGSISLL